MYKNVKNIALDFIPFVLYKDSYIKRANYKTINKEEKRIIIDKEICTKRVWHDFYLTLLYPHELKGKLY
jgi:hypothetical protein